MCEDLSLAHEITFIAGPSYHVGERARRLWTRERMGRVTIIRTWGTRLPKQRLPLRLTNLATYFALATIAAMRLERPDIIVAETDPPLLGALGAILKRRWQCRLVYNVRDLYPDIAHAIGGVKNPLLLSLLERGNRLAFDRADRVVVIGHDMRARVLAKGVPEDRTVVVPDWVDCERIRPLASNPFRAQFGDKFVVMYSGNLGLSQQLDTVLQAAEILRDDQRIVFALIGEGANKKALMQHAAARALVNIMFMPYQPKDKLAESLGAADLHLIPLAPGTAGCLVPSKIYAILAAGRPFVAMMDETAEVARIAREEAVGFVIRPGDARALASAIGDAIDRPEILRQMGARARRVAVDRFDRHKVTREFDAMLTRVAVGPA
ncbi:MAG TPA: glycosyltransferase family 4 protein [Candidatus Binataceae bacterium]|nr:glycosyltransferase family 4 protein [Candidatus Binataceae bacterium]